ncbi:DUF2922 domain-containing protein [Vagococcus xieshaowenii]|uniref:DUF2922 domain-containing protein n=1 Tax=Vagococcus xieshaowenii TaxID=2562451 RepID=A0AAJ5JLY5_9ENTE|nr:DUF2922 domain-containing protein [Vagococcus xieshaowenii]QCA29248.1 DUF2922 domain-containing protein [Vagococcus xieshaowenii]TFZ43240.1 DUF2922 domain-containing protein [Vagococcus xieshaowenii]
MKKLRMNFTNAEETISTLTYANCHQNLTAEEIQEAMATIAELKLISKGGILQYEIPQSANYIETTVTEIF